jgi:hypothetical protein
MQRTTIFAAALTLVLSFGAQAQGQETKIDNALSAAPHSIAQHAAVVDWDDTELRAGTNGWTCMPTPPQMPENSPMCFDAQWLEWAHAWVNKSKPRVTQVGLSYMLQGGVDASNTDPFATEPAPGADWMTTGPHLMPTEPNGGGAWVMFKDTPYAHIMAPVAKR